MSVPMFCGLRGRSFWGHTGMFLLYPSPAGCPKPQVMYPSPAGCPKPQVMYPSLAGCPKTWVMYPSSVGCPKPYVSVLCGLSETPGYVSVLCGLFEDPGYLSSKASVYATFPGRKKGYRTVSPCFRMLLFLFCFDSAIDNRSTASGNPADLSNGCSPGIHLL